MKGTNLGEFEELTLLIVGIKQGDAYGINVKDEIELNTKRKASVSTVHTALNRLEKKGYVNSYYGGASKERGGRTKRLYKITALGVNILSEAKEQRESLWQQFALVMPELKYGF